MTEPTPDTPATTDLRMAVEEALGKCLAFRAGQAFGVPRDAGREYLAAVTQAVVDVMAPRVAAARTEAAGEFATVYRESFNNVMRGAEALAALRELVRLKDGPRDAAYERDKSEAWAAARAAVVASSAATSEGDTP
jgi:hypothetical protein